MFEMASNVSFENTDSSEDEIFFGPISNKESNLIRKYRRRKTEIYKPNFRDSLKSKKSIGDHRSVDSDLEIIAENKDADNNMSNLSENSATIQNVDEKINKKRIRIQFLNKSNESASTVNVEKSPQCKSRSMKKVEISPVRFFYNLRSSPTTTSSQTRPKVTTKRSESLLKSTLKKNHHKCVTKMLSDRLSASSLSSPEECLVARKQLKKRIYFADVKNSNTNCRPLEKTTSDHDDSPPLLFCSLSSSEAPSSGDSQSYSDSSESSADDVTNVSRVIVRTVEKYTPDKSSAKKQRAVRCHIVF